MKWIAISGSWRTTNFQLECDVRNAVTEELFDGHGIVTGGALGVDFFATDQALRMDRARQLLVILPTSLETYLAHFAARAREGVISTDQAEDLASQLKRLRDLNLAGLQTMDFNECTPTTYRARNTEVIKRADALLAFHVNESGGVQDAIDKAHACGILVRAKSYTIPTK